MARAHGALRQECHDHHSHEQRRRDEEHDRQADQLEHRVRRFGPLWKHQPAQHGEADVRRGHQPDVAVGDVGELMGDDGAQLLVVEPVDQAACDHHDGVALADPAGEGVQRRRFDHADVRGRKAPCDRQRLDDVAQPRLVMMVDEVEGQRPSHRGDMPGHLKGEDCRRSQGDKGNIAHRIAAPIQERRVPFVDPGERQIEHERRRQLQGQDEAAEQRDRAPVVGLDPAEKAVDREHGRRLRT